MTPIWRKKGKMIAYVAIGLCLLITGCVGGTSQSSRFYDLSLNTCDVVVSNQYKHSIVVARVQMPKFLDKPQMVLQNQNTQEVLVSEFHRWVEPLSILFTHTISENLNTLLPQAKVSQESGDMIVKIDILKLQASLNHKGKLEAWYTVSSSKGNLLCSKKFIGETYLKENYESLASAYSKLIGDLSNSIACTLVLFK